MDRRIEISIEVDGTLLSAQLDNGVDISIGIGPGSGPRLYGIPPARISVYRSGGFVGNVDQGGTCNVREMNLNPHGNGTHTECVGHIGPEYHTIDQVLKSYLFVARLLTIPHTTCIAPSHLKPLLGLDRCQALVLRTSPNPPEKRSMDYDSRTEVPFLSPKTMQLIVDLGVNHLLVDLPSVDKMDDPNLEAHRVFWNSPSGEISFRTITELVYVPDHVGDGTYLLNLMVPNFVLDAVPSKPILYPLH